MNQYIELKTKEWQRVLDFFKKDISNLRTGRANPSVLEGVQVEAYGSRSSLNAVAGITTGDGMSIVVSPWDKNVIKEVEKAIREADLGVGIINEGDKIRITIPKMTEENRKELVRKLNEKQEKARVAIRQVREEIKEAIEKAEENKEINEDDKFRYIKELDEEVGKKNDELKEIREKKEEEIMTV
ncbi:MAG: ribosome recycling factor [Patescibacteria group bacterium]